MIGRSMHLFLETQCAPERCRLLPESFPLGEEDQPQMETLLDNAFSIQLVDSEGAPHYLREQQQQQLPVTVVLNQSDRRLLTEHPGFSFADYHKGGAEILMQPGCIGAGGKTEH